VPARRSMAFCLVGLLTIPLARNGTWISTAWAHEKSDRAKRSGVRGLDRAFESGVKPPHSERCFWHPNLPLSKCHSGLEVSDANS